MPVFINDIDAIERLASVEGREWARGQEDASRSDTVAAFREVWRAEYEPELAEMTPEMRDEVVNLGGGRNAIYGKEGYHRYLVLWSGEIVFSAYFCELPDKYRRLVEAADIRVVGRWKDV